MQHIHKQILQYRALKLESIRKNLIYQKKVLTGIALEWDQNHNHQIKERWNKKKHLRRFKYEPFIWSGYRVQSN